MEDGGYISSDPHRGDHEPQLADGGIGKHALDIKTSDRDAGREQRGRGSDDRNDVRCHSRKLKQSCIANKHVDAGGHHRGGVDKCRNRSRSGHRIGKPDKEWDLGRLAGRANEKKERDGGGGADGGGPHRLGFRKDLFERQGSEEPERNQHCDNESKVSNTVDDEGLFACQRVPDPVLALLIPKADQKVGA